MLRLIALYFATGLASVACRYPQPEFNHVYSMKMVVYRPPYVPYTMNVWYDGPNNKSRFDYVESTQKIVIMRTPDYKYGVATAVIPITTEAQTNIPLCFNVTGTQKAPVNLIQYLKRMSYSYVFKKQEVVNGEDTEMWQFKSMHEEYTYENTWWITFKELHGVRQAVPVKSVNIRHNNVKGIQQHIWVYEFFSYDTAPIDPDVFNIAEGFTCNSANSSKVHHLLKGHPGLSHDAFMSFKDAHGKKYDSEEEHEIRLGIFRKNLMMIEAHNREDHGYKMALNHFADRSDDELERMFGRLPSDTLSDALTFPYSDLEVEELSKELPKRFDWRLHGGVTRVKDQMDCGSSWAFGAIGAVEAAFFMHKNNSKAIVHRLSEQALIDCSWGFGNKGCAGGREEYAFDYIKKHGIPSYGAYGWVYRGMEGKCHSEKVQDREVTKISGYVKVKPDVNALKLAILKHGAVSAGMHANHNFLLYSGGVYSDPKCSQSQLNHVVLVVGWGVLGGQEYWIVKNSWTINWGIEGYALISIKDNMCGIQTNAHYVTFEK